MLTALLAIITKAETDLVFATTGRPSSVDADHLAVPRRNDIRRLRRIAQAVKIHRSTGAIEASLLMATAAVLKSAGWAEAEEALAIGLFAVAAVLGVAHAVSILSSNRLSPRP